VTIEFRSGDCRDVLATLPADSVQCCVTSPPYYGLRDYGCAGQIGLEATPDKYLATMVAVFREVRRVLRPDGTCWVNMGDSYNSYRGNAGPGASLSSSNQHARQTVPGGAGLWVPNAKPKDLLMMPARLALALQADGWWLRSDIIWHKPNPMPESVTDRPTSAHEHVFLLTKSARYFYDADAVREEAEYGRSGGPGAFRSSKYVAGASHDNGADVVSVGAAIPGNGGSRNLRNVWTIATAPYSEAHFATFPPALAERCIRAGTSERGCCSQCGKPWVRVTERGEPNKQTTRGQQPWAAVTGQRDSSGGLPHCAITTTGWHPSCTCHWHLAQGQESETVPCTVLDPFAGAGTTLLVADRLQRDAIGIELNTAYTEMAMQRCRDDAPLFADLPPATDPEDARMADLFGEVAV
jgi:DNA modification methylase